MQPGAVRGPGERVGNPIARRSRRWTRRSAAGNDQRGVGAVEQHLELVVQAVDRVLVRQAAERPVVDDGGDALIDHIHDRTAGVAPRLGAVRDVGREDEAFHAVGDGQLGEKVAERRHRGAVDPAKDVPVPRLHEDARLPVARRSGRLKALHELALHAELPVPAAPVAGRLAQAGTARPVVVDPAGPHQCADQRPGFVRASRSGPGVVVGPSGVEQIDQLAEVVRRRHVHQVMDLPSPALLVLPRRVGDLFDARASHLRRRQRGQPI